MLRVLALFVLSIGFTAAHAADIDCKVKSRNYPTLEEGWNKRVLCEDLVAELEQELGQKVVTAKLRLKDTWMSTYRVGIKFKAKVNGKRYRGYGIQHWSPDGHTFVIDHLQ